MEEADPMPFPELLEVASPSLSWAAEWIYASETAFTRWARGLGIPLIEGTELFEAQAAAQSRRFIEGCG